MYCRRTHSSQHSSSSSSSSPSSALSSGSSTSAAWAQSASTAAGLLLTLTIALLLQSVCQSALQGRTARTVLTRSAPSDAVHNLAAAPAQGRQQKLCGGAPRASLAGVRQLSDRFCV